MFIPENNLFIPENNLFIPENNLFIPENWVGIPYTIFNSLKDFLNLYITLCRGAKRNYYSANLEKIEKYKKESKKTWQTIWEILILIVKDKSKSPEYL